MRLKTMIFLATAALCGSAASAQSSEPADAPAAEAKPVAACGHKFETSIQTLTNGKPHTSQVKLCGEAGQTDAQWMITLKDALSKVEANAKMPAEVKTQIAVALRSEIGKVENNGAGGGMTVVNVAPPAAAVDLPAPVASPVPAPVAVPVKAAPAPAKPRLSFECYTPGDIGAGGPCTTLTRDTLVTVKTSEALANGYALRFVSRNEPRGEVALQPMRKGKSVRVRLPAAVCAGGGAGSVEIQIVSGGAMLDSRGPFILRC